MNKYEKLIEYIVNEDSAKANDLFHEIVVEKSRDIYESLMDSEEEMGGDPADELMSDISADEDGMTEDDEMAPMGDEMGMDDGMGMDDEMAPMGDEMGMDDNMDADLEDRVVDIEDQLDDLMAEFDAMMGGDEMGGGMDDMGDGMDDEMGMDDGMGDEMGMDAEPEMEGMFNENVALTKVTKGISNSSESEGTNKKSINADNSGKKGSAATPHQTNGDAVGGANPTVKPGNSTTKPNQSKVAEPKKKGEDAGVNKKSLSGS